VVRVRPQQPHQIRTESSSMKSLSGPRKRKVNADPHPELAEAVAVTRFWRNVGVGAPDECWSWAGSIDQRGYGEFFYRGRNRRAHELALSFTVGEIRHESLDTCHECDNPVCCNPAHLRFDTRQSNVDDMVRRNRHPIGSARSKSGLDESDVLIIRERRALGARQKDLASDFGVSEAAIVAIVHGRNWKHVGGPITHNKKAA